MTMQFACCTPFKLLSFDLSIHLHWLDVDRGGGFGVTCSLPRQPSPKTSCEESPDVCSSAGLQGVAGALGSALRPASGSGWSP